MSNLAIAYSGPIAMPPAVSTGPGSNMVRHNPLSSVPSNNIQLSSDEVDDAIDALGYPVGWNQLNPSQQKRVAAAVLYNRGDPTSTAQAGQVIMSNPAFQTFQIIFGAAGL